MFTYEGKTALITGASSGIGESFARALAARRMNVILVARSEDRLQALANDLSLQHGIRAEVVTADFKNKDASLKVCEAVHQRDLQVHLLVNNAGIGTYGPFETVSPAADQEVIMVNIMAIVNLTHAFVPAMLEHGEGGVINVASIAAFQPGCPYLAVYAATKAFLLSFSGALWGQYRHSGLRVLALCPGPVSTRFDAGIASTEILPDWPRHSPEQVVETGLRAFGKARNYVIGGWRNYFMALFSQIFPRSLVLGSAEKMLRPPSAGPPSTSHK